MGFTVGAQKGPRSEINVTPMVDVVLVLLIIFMVVTPMLQRNKDVVLPRATNIDEANREEDPLTISITSDQAVWVGNSQVEVGRVKPVVEAALKEQPNRLVLIKGDERLPIKQVRLVMKEVQDAGAKSVGLGVDKPEGEP